MTIINGSTSSFVSFPHVLPHVESIQWPPSSQDSIRFVDGIVWNSYIGWHCFAPLFAAQEHSALSDRLAAALKRIAVLEGGRHPEP